MDLPRLRQKHRWRRKIHHRRLFRYRFFRKSKKMSEKELEYYRTLYYSTQGPSVKESLYKSFPYHLKNKMNLILHSAFNKTFENFVFKQNRIPLWLLKKIPIRRTKRRLNISFEW